jgi:hypothetical protein
MTAAQTLPQKLQSSNGEQPGERPGPQRDPWEEAPVPAKVAKRIGEGIFQKRVSPDLIPLLTNVMHWGTGIGWGAVYGLIAGSVRLPPLRSGLAFGAGVMAMSYVQLVPMGLYELPWKYSPEELGTELGYHLAYGAGVGASWRIVASVG